MDRTLSDFRGRVWSPHGGLHRGAVLLVVLALLLGGAAGCGTNRAASPSAASGEMPDQEVSDFVLTETDQGMPVWKLYARYAATYNARNVIVARTVRVDFFDEQGAQSSELTAREGEIQLQTPRHDRPRQRGPADPRGHAHVHRGDALPEPAAADRLADRADRAGRAQRATC